MDKVSIIGEYYEEEVIPKYQKVIDKQQELLKICLEAFNELPNKDLKKNSKFQSTYEIAFKIDELLNNKK